MAGTQAGELEKQTGSKGWLELADGMSGSGHKHKGAGLEAGP